MIRIILLYCLIVVSNELCAQRYLIKFTDKVGFNDADKVLCLSPIAVRNRSYYSLPVDEKDYSVSKSYLDSLSKFPLSIIRTSRWFNAVMVILDDTNILKKLRTISFIKSIEYLGAIPQPIIPASFNMTFGRKTEEWNGFQRGYYDKEHHQPRLQGFSYQQLQMIYQDAVDSIPIQPISFIIAVFDAGFQQMNQLNCFKHLYNNHHIIETYDFSSEDMQVYDDDDHGTKVMSCLASFDSFNIMGSAPFADFLLYRTEESIQETRAEEYFWVFAAERADSIGARLISSSLGYNTFDIKEQSYSVTDLNGRTTIISQAVQILSQKGIMVVTSSGNEGDKNWHYITFPGDSKYALTVGACDAQGVYSDFSSVGPTQDGRIKPDIVAKGSETTVCMQDGTYGTSNGSSFSAPIIAGFMAQLINLHRSLVDSVLFDAVRFSGSQAYHSNNEIGYGIPDFAKAHQLLKLYETKKVYSVLAEFSESANEYIIRGLKTPESKKVVLRNGSKFIGEYIINPANHSIFYAGKIKLKRKPKKDSIYTLNVLSLDNKVLSTQVLTYGR